MTRGTFAKDSRFSAPTRNITLRNSLIKQESNFSVFFAPLTAASSTGLDIAKSLALTANLASISQPVLEAAVKGAKKTEKLLSCLIDELRNVMFLVGAENLESLAKVPAVVTGKTAEWLNIRGFDTVNYAQRSTLTFEY